MRVQSIQAMYRYVCTCGAVDNDSMLKACYHSSEIQTAYVGAFIHDSKCDQALSCVYIKRILLACVPLQARVICANRYDNCD